MKNLGKTQKRARHRKRFILFTSFFFFALLFLLQTFLIIVTFQLVELIFEALDSIFTLIFAILVRIFVFNIINRRENPEYKLPWLFLVIIEPLFGMVVYFMFAKHKMKKKEIRALKEISLRSEKYSVAPDEEKREQREFLGSAAGISNYISATSRLDGRLNNDVKYYKIGELLWKDLLIELEKAEKFIFMEYFIVDPGVMWDSIHEILVRKAKEGVEIRFLYDDIGSMSMLPGRYYKKLRKEGINCYKFNKFKPIISGIYNNRDHRKITVIDGKVGFTGGINLGDEYVNENDRLGHWKDTGIRIKGSAVNNLTTMFLSTFDMTSKTISDYDKYYVLSPEKYENCGFIQPFGDGPKPYYAEQIGENNYINMIAAAKKFVYITTPYLITDHNVATALRNAAYRGVDVRIITPHIPDKKIILNMTRSNYPYLLETGVRIYEYTPGFIHAKMLVADGEAAFVGTINFDYRSLTHHYECGAVIIKSPCVKEITEDIMNTFDVSQEITKENFHLSKFTRFINAILQVLAPML